MRDSGAAYNECLHAAKGLSSIIDDAFELSSHSAIVIRQPEDADADDEMGAGTSAKTVTRKKRDATSDGLGLIFQFHTGTHYVWALLVFRSLGPIVEVYEHLVLDGGHCVAHNISQHASSAFVHSVVDQLHFPVTVHMATHEVRSKQHLAFTTTFGLAKLLSDTVGNPCTWEVSVMSIATCTMWTSVLIVDSLRCIEPKDYHFRCILEISNPRDPGRC